MDLGNNSYGIQTSPCGFYIYHYYFVAVEVQAPGQGASGCYFFCFYSFNTV